jgi:hypothetical protein
MSSDELESYLRRHENERLRVVMSSGDEWVIEHPGRTIVDGLSLYVQMYEKVASRMSPRVRIVSIPNINYMEPIRPGSNGGRRPRRRR